MGRYMQVYLLNHCQTLTISYIIAEMKCYFHHRMHTEYSKSHVLNLENCVYECMPLSVVSHSYNAVHFPHPELKCYKKVFNFFLVTFADIIVTRLKNREFKSLDELQCSIIMSDTDQSSSAPEAALYNTL